MKAAGVFVLISIAALSTTAKADETCEKIENHNWNTLLGTLKTCHMHSTAIDSKDFSITSDRDESVKGFHAYNNKQLEHLPNNLGAKFPNLLGLYAVLCSIKEVSKDNFEGLGKLRQLFLYDNEIEKIEDDTFEYIPAVEYIHLADNKIKKLNGLAFASLHKLTHVYLYSNECIHGGFTTATRIAELPRIVTRKCGFTESEQSPTKNGKSEADLMEQIKAQLRETCDARIELKLQENVKCSNDLQAKTAEINDKNEKIKQLEKKIQILGGDGP